jgi:replicative DNA helicase
MSEALAAALEIEQNIIGCALYEPDGCTEAFERLRPEHFAEPCHRLIWEEITRARAAGAPADMRLVDGRLAGGPGYAEFGGVRYLEQMVNKASLWALKGHVEATVDAATRRAIKAAGERIVALATDHPDGAKGALLASERVLDAVAQASPASTAWLSAGAIVPSAVAHARQRKGGIELPTGLRELDELTGGLRRGEMQIIAGRPAMGKSSAGLTVARSLASRGLGVAFFSMEMPKVALGLRMACDVAFDPDAPSFSGESSNPTYFKADRGELSSEQWGWLEASGQKMAGWPLLFDTRPGLTVSAMESCARRAFWDWKRDGVEPGAIIVDHLTIARPDNDRKGNKVAEVGDISRGLAEMAKRLDVPVVALCQLSRDVEKRDNKDRRPGLSDLRWSGEIEQDARLVTFLYRPEYYCRRPEDEDDDDAVMEWRAKLDKVRKKLWWLVEKNNNGPTGEVETYCDIACSAIRDRRGL